MEGYMAKNIARAMLNPVIALVAVGLLMALFPSEFLGVLLFALEGFSYIKG